MSGNKNEKQGYVNSWLVDSEFIKKQEFADNYYLESLCYAINSFLKNTPVPIRAKLSDNFSHDNVMEFFIGSIKNYLKVSVDYSYFDFITQIKNWAYEYYPQYTVEYEIDVPYSHEEMIKMVKDGMDMNDVIAMRKKEKVLEKGVIEKIMLKEDKFIFKKNDNRYIYISGTIQNPIPLSVFKKNLLTIKDDTEKKKYIEKNSTLVSEYDKVKEIIIDYQGRQMLNFFKINEGELLKHNMQNISPFIWKCGRFIIKFSSQSLMDDCLRYLHNR